jgi:hypothetical protein
MFCNLRFHGGIDECTDCLVAELVDSAAPAAVADADALAALPCLCCCCCTTEVEVISSGLKRMDIAGRLGNRFKGTGGGLAKARSCMNMVTVKTAHAARRYESAWFKSCRKTNDAIFWKAGGSTTI